MIGQVVAGSLDFDLDSKQVAKGAACSHFVFNNRFESFEEGDVFAGDRNRFVEISDVEYLLRDLVDDCELLGEIGVVKSLGVRAGDFAFAG